MLILSHRNNKQIETSEFIMFKGINALRKNRLNRAFKNE